MTFSLFVLILSIASAATSIMTEAIKTYFKNIEKPYSANMIALINALIIGVGGTAVVYILGNVKFCPANIVCMILMGLCVWIGSMIGYDKVIQLLNQITYINKEETPEEE